MAFTGEGIDQAGRLRVALALTDLLGGHFLVTWPIHSAQLGPEGPLPAELLRGGCRRRLVAVRGYPAVTGSPWCD
ncbi:hypothetical protein [Streptomyces sp. NPDC001389]|uniref:hypothetical protein n=1 Tax=Streptomyces sp. NPDC001389 TaxID=3364569 RepID=UPI0036A3B6C5